MQYVVMFFRFWWDFFIGDTPELALGTLAVTGITMLLVREHINAVAFVPATLIALLGISVYLGTRRS